MKTIILSLKRLLAIAILALVLPGCLDIYFTTDVHQNGSITKTVVLEGDSTEILSFYLPFINDESWTHEWIKGDDDKYKLALSKTFKSAKKAAKELNPPDSLPQIRFEPELKRKFRWFFTYIDYKDILLATNPFQKVDWRDYLTDDEIALINMDDDQREASPLYSESAYDSTETRFENYLLTSGFEEFFQLCIKAVRNTSFKNIAANNITADDILSKKEAIKDTALNYINNHDISSSNDALGAFKLVINEDIIDQIEKQNPDIFGYFDKKLDFFNNVSDDQYYFTIRMPGLLVSTNSNKVEGNNLSWELDFFDSYFNDYVMSAESRVVNIWAFVVTGIAIAFLLFSLIVKLFRKKT